MHLELLEVQRRIQARIPLPSFDFNERSFKSHQAEARPLLRFEDIPLELTELRLAVRQTADILRRFGALDEADFQKIQALGRDESLVSVVGRWYRAGVEKHVATACTAVDRLRRRSGRRRRRRPGLALAMRPFLSRCAEVLAAAHASWQAGSIRIALCAAASRNSP